MLLFGNGLSYDSFFYIVHKSTVRLQVAKALYPVTKWICSVDLPASMAPLSQFPGHQPMVNPIQSELEPRQAK